MTDSHNPLDDDLTELIELLPWFLNGTLDAAERRRVERALETSPELRDQLRETAAALDLADERPSTATLVALAAGELEGEERIALEARLEKDPSDAELVELAREGIAGIAADDGAERGVVTPFPGRPHPGLWRPLALAASLIAVVALTGWLASLRRGPGPQPAIAAVRVLELLPEELVVRGTEPEPPRRGGAPVRVALVLVTESRAAGDDLELSVRDADDREIARLEDLELGEDGTVSALLEASLLDDAASLVLTVPDPASAGGSRVLHRYRLRRAS